MSLLQSLYHEQQAKVRTDRLSKSFPISRGTKQGDPLSALLFNALLEKIVREVKPQWAKKRYGIQLGVGDSHRVTNLRFADDVLLVAGSKAQLISMLTDFKAAALKCGLELHPDKTKIMTTATKNAGRNRYADVSGMQVEIVPRAQPVKYLGAHISCESRQELELKHRIRAAWAKFAAQKQELTNKHYALPQRLRLFDAVVTPTALYASSTWTMTKCMEQELCRTQRRMLRMILGAGRRRQPASTTTQTDGDSGSDVASDGTNDVDNLVESGMTDLPTDCKLEPWQEWVRRTTHQVEDQLKKLNVDSWVTRVRRNQWRMAHRASIQHSMRWSRLAAAWQPALFFDGGRSRAHRVSARPKKRWSDDIAKFLQYADVSGGGWLEVAQHEELWAELEDRFVLDDWRHCSVRL